MHNPVHAARALADQLKEDIAQATTRNEHVRLTARANEAEILARMLETQADDCK